MKLSCRAYTLIELLAVIAVIAVLIAIFVPVAQKAVHNMKLKQVRADITRIEAAVELYKKDYGSYPSARSATIESSLYANCFPATTTLETYIKFPEGRTSDSVFLDPWFMPYRYTSPGANNTSFVDIASAGPDREFGTWAVDTGTYNAGDTDVADNINNWTEK